jgi:hypothetical protein
MQSKSQIIKNKQKIYQELFIGTLIYAVTLGFFNDYTNIVEARSFSTIFYAAVVLQILTMLVFLLKDKVLLSLKGRHKALIAFCLWFIMFSSKFIFIWTIDLIFNSYVSINGFFGIFAVVLAATLAHKLYEKIFIMLDHSQR